MSEIRYEISTTEIKPYTYKTPLVAIDEHGEPLVKYSKATNAKHIKKLQFLYLVGRDENSNLVSYEPFDDVNRFLMACHIDDGREETAQYSKGLVHYFSFIIELQKQWDVEHAGLDAEELEEEIAEGLIVERPTWNKLPLRSSDKVTYKYHAALRNTVLNPLYSKDALARTTATAYMNVVIRFYSYLIRNGYDFTNVPFNYEMVTIYYQAGSTSMKPYMSKVVQTTDLRLNFPKSKRNAGGTLPSTRRDLRPLTDSEWKIVEAILLKSQTVLKNVKGEMKERKLALEYCLFFLIARYSGLRKEEVASLHRSQIIKPDSNKKMIRFGVGANYGSLTKGSGNKSRRTIIPVALMQRLYEYTRSDRYQRRLAKFKNMCQSKREAGEHGLFGCEDGINESLDYLFISTTGKPFHLKLNELNARWNEVRATVLANTGQAIQGTVHNLRSTFAVALFRVLLRNETKDVALAHVSECLGHEDQATTLLYLQIAEDNPAGDEIYEDILEFAVFDDAEFESIVLSEGVERE